jgi:hypothetical protein
MATLFPEVGDPDAAQLFASLGGRQNAVNYVEDGLSITVEDSSTLNVTAGKCFISRPSATISGLSKTVTNLSYVVELESTTLVSRLSNDDEHVAVVPNYSSGSVDDVSVTAYASSAGVPDTALEIGVVSNSDDSVVESNRDPDVTVEDVVVTGVATFDSNAEVGGDLVLSGSLETPNGTTLLDSTDGELQSANLSENTITINTTGDATGGGSVSLGGSVDIGVSVPQGYSDTDAVSAIDSEISTAANTISGLDTQVNTNASDITTLQSDKLSVSEYTPETDTHDKYTDQNAVSAADGEVTDSANTLSGLDTTVNNLGLNKLSRDGSDSMTGALSYDGTSLYFEAGDTRTHQMMDTGDFNIGGEMTENTSL